MLVLILTFVSPTVSVGKDALEDISFLKLIEKRLMSFGVKKINASLKNPVCFVFFRVA